MIFVFDIEPDRQRFLQEVERRFANIVVATADTEQASGRLIVRVEFVDRAMREAAFQADFRQFAITMGGAPLQ